jgi:hypothetical protein
MTMDDIKGNWLTVIKEWESSDLTQAEFCKQKEIKKVTFGYWRNKFISSGDVESRAVKTSLDTNAPSGFIPFDISPAATTDGKIIEIILPHGISLRIPADVRVS